MASSFLDYIRIRYDQNDNIHYVGHGKGPIVEHCHAKALNIDIAVCIIVKLLRIVQNLKYIE